MTTGCTADQTLSACTASEQCNLGRGGECLPPTLGADLCAYPNAACENTSLAGGQLSGELTGKCVVDYSAPAIVSSSPDDAATDVGTAINIVAEFSEPIDPATMTPTSFIAPQGRTRVAGTLTVSGHTAAFDFGVRLAPNAMYAVTIGTDVEDTYDTGDASRANVCFNPTLNMFHGNRMQATSGKHHSVFTGSFE